MKFGSDITSLIWKLKDDQRERLKVLLLEFEKEGLRVFPDDYVSSNDFTMKEIADNIDSTIEFEKEQEIKQKAADKNETTIPKDKWGVHEHHCCDKHGCKYGDVDCPVVLKLIKQKYPCEDCEE